MKQGKTLVSLAQELEAINASKRDFIVPVNSLTAIENGGHLNLAFTGPAPDNASNPMFGKGEQHNYQLNSFTSGQVAQFAKIPTQYFRRLETEAPELLAKNINHGFDKTDKSHRMLRTVNTDGVPRVRGFVSDKYRTLDSYDLLEAVLPTFQKHSLEVVSSEITDKRLFIKALSPRLRGNVSVGDEVQYGIVVSNSDVGAGAIRVEPLIYRLVCQNGMISATSFKKYHVGRAKAEADLYELLTDKTKKMDDAVIWAKVTDLVEASLKPEFFTAELEKLRSAKNDVITSADPLKVVDVTMKQMGIAGEAKRNGIIAALASGNEGAGYTKWGLINSITRVAHADEVTYEDSIDLERAAGKILELNPTQWANIANAA